MRKYLALTIALGLLTIGLTGCGEQKQTSTPTETPKTKVVLVGSTSVDPLVKVMAKAYQEKHSNVAIETQAVGSGAGIKAVTDGTAAVGMSSRDLTQEEKDKGLKDFVIAIDGLAVVVNPKNNVSDITKDKLTKLYKGEIKNWKELGGADKPVVLVSREAGSGTRDDFEKLLKLVVDKDGKKVSALDEKALIATGNGEVKANVATKEGAIGYLSLGFVDESTKKITVDGVACNVDNVKTKKYIYQRPFLLLAKGDLTGEAKSFFDFIISADGQAIAEKEGYIKIK